MATKWHHYYGGGSIGYCSPSLTRSTFNGDTRKEAEKAKPDKSRRFAANAVDSEPPVFWKSPLVRKIEKLDRKQKQEHRRRRKNGEFTGRILPTLKP